MKSEMADGENKRKVGRPRGRFDNSEAWARAEDLYVHGELSVGPHGPTTSYPSLRTIARRCGLTAQAVHYRVKTYDWLGRRERFRAATDRKVDEIVAETRANVTRSVLDVVNDYIALFDDAVAKGKVRHDSLQDLDRAIRLRAFILGEAESRTEQRTVLSLEDLQSRHRTMRERALQSSCDVAGVLSDEGGNSLPLDD